MISESSKMHGATIKIKITIFTNRRNTWSVKTFTDSM
jgi:hypothetical protein